VSKNVWSPFNRSLKEVSNFDVLDDNPLELPDTNINEFRQLNSVLVQMTQKIRRDYINLKEYNENSSHEIQTPLAVIRSKLDILMQDKKLNRENINLIKSINEAVAKIFKLNQDLLLISKIENNQFIDTQEVSLRSMIKRILNNYEEIMQLKKIKIDTYFSDPANITMNEILADVMLSNLLGNAVRYNINGGFITCRLDDKQLTITNSGLPLRADPGVLFDRFRKGTDHPEAVGLGLSIVKKITDYYGMHITFSSSGTVHEIILSFRNLSLS
jgi:signal transduction histidine kinase